jgi:hypothetical protein
MTQTVAELEAALERAKADQKEHARRVRAEAEEHQAAVARLAKENQGRVDDLERRVRAALKTTTNDDVLPPLRARQVARGYLHGSLGELPAMWGPDDAIAAFDERAATLLGLARESARILEVLADPLRADFLPGDDPLVVRCDRLEAETFRAFAARVRHLAAED